MKFCRPINTKGQPASIARGFSTLHTGIDYAYPTGTDVYASQEGIVVMKIDLYDKNWRNLWGRLTTKDYGNLIKIRHPLGFSTLYAHLKKNSLKVNVGDSVAQGQKIAEVNNTGNSTGPHLHWELRLSERCINPVPFVDTSYKNYKP